MIAGFFLSHSIKTTGACKPNPLVEAGMVVDSSCCFPLPQLSVRGREREREREIEVGLKRCLELEF